MKKLYFLLLFVSSVSFAQTNYIIDKKGTKLYVRDDMTEVILIDKRIAYTLVGKTWEKYIKFDDLDYAVIGRSVLKSFKVDGKKAKVYFVLGEKENMKLIGVKITVTTSSGNLSSSRDYYEIIVVDNDDKVIDKVRADSGRSKENVAEIARIATMIRNNFSDCPKVMAKLSEYEREDSILGFITDTDYINCKQ